MFNSDFEEMITTEGVKESYCSEISPTVLERLSKLLDGKHAPPAILTPAEVQEKMGLKASLLNEEPQILQVEGVISVLDSKRLIKYAKQHAEPVDKLHAGANKKSIRNNKEVELMFGQPGQYPENVQRVMKKISALATTLANVPEENLESLELHVTSKHEFFKLHHDFAATFDEFLSPEGARPWTLIIYLNDDVEGAALRWAFVAGSYGRRRRGSLSKHPDTAQTCCVCASGGRTLFPNASAAEPDLAGVPKTGRAVLW